MARTYKESRNANKIMTREQARYDSYVERNRIYATSLARLDYDLIDKALNFINRGCCKETIYDIFCLNSTEINYIEEILIYN